MPNPTFQAIVSATNQSGAAFKAVRSDLAGVRREADAARGSLTRLGESRGRLSSLGGVVRSLSGHFGELKGKIGETHGMLSGLLPALAGLGALGSVPGLFELVHKVAEARAGFIATADKIGISTRALGGFEFAAKMAHVPVEAVEGGLVKLNRSLGDAGLGKNKMAAAVLQRLGFSLKDIQSGAVKAEQVLPRLADAFAKTENASLKTTVAMALFGRGGAAMIPLLNKGGEAMREAAEDSARLRYAFSAGDDKALEEYEHGMIRLQTAVGGVTNAIGAKLAPALTPIVEAMTDWLVVNRDWVASGIKDAVLGFANLPWKAMGEDIRSVWTTVSGMVESVGGWKIAIEGVLGLSFAGWAAGAIAALGPLGVMLAGMAATLAAIKSMEGDFKPENLAPNSPLWRGMPREQQLNYPNSPESLQRPTAEAPSGGGDRNPYPFSWWNPGSWLNRGDRPTALAPAGPPGAAPVGVGPGADMEAGQPERLPSPYAAPAPAAAPAEGKVQIQINIPNMPLGGSVSATSSGGGVAQPEVNVGQANPMGGF